MKIECIKEKLHMAVLKAEKVTTKNNTLPILSCILFETKGNTLLVRSTNLDLGIEINISVKVDKPGKVAVPASVMVSFLNNITDNKNIYLELVDSVLKVSTEHTETSIKTLATDDFPTIPTLENGKVCKIQSQDLQNGIKSVSYSAAVSSVKPELASVYIYNIEDVLYFVATDSFRLAEKTIHTKKKADLPGLLLPFKNAMDILKITDGLNQEIEINATKNQISFNTSDIYIVSRVVDGMFPDYKQIIPKEEKTTVTLLKQDLVNALKLSNVFSDAFNQIHIRIESKDQKIYLQTKNTNIGENINMLEATVAGEAIEVNFNYKYITESLPYINSDSVTLFLNGINKPLVMKGSSDKTFTYLVMPMNR